ncbi:MAG: methionyl-tRNA formyltransferase [Rhodospirillales bacterium]|nr:MAG: methionyl-tRNA formyltransferase [Rhodospirillales bacterium]
MTPLRLVFLGTPAFAVPTLAALVDSAHDVLAVYAQPPRPAGRGQREQPSPVQAFAEARHLPVRTPRTLRAADAQRDFDALGADAAVVAAYGLILPQPVLDTPRLGCFNVHASLLPRWRGAAPIQRALLAGDAETGVTIMQVDAGLDTGPILMQEAVPITATTTAAELHDTLAALGARMMIEALQAVAAGRLSPRPQPAAGATYAAKLQRDEGRLDWSRPAQDLERAVRALNPWPGTWFEHGGERVRVLAATLATLDREAGSVPPGTVIDDRLTVACGAGGLRCLRLQRPGRAPLETEAFLRGYPLPPGSRLH